MTSLALTALAIQPLFFNQRHQNIASSIINLDETTTNIGDCPNWVADIEALYPNRHFFYQVLTPENEVVIDNQSFRLTAYLCSNTSLNQHLVLFELHASISETSHIAIEKIRSALVLDVTDQRLAIVIKSLDRARALIAETGGCQAQDISIAPNTCNLTLALQVPSTGQQQPALDISQRIFDNSNYERLSANLNRRPIDISDHTRVYFGGRAHVAVSTSVNDIALIKEIMLMLQVMWFFVPLYLRHAAELHRKIVADQKIGNLANLQKSATQLIYCYQAIQLQNEAAKFSYESMTDLFYEKVESLWNVERSIAQLARYTDFFTAFIKDVREEQAQKSDSLLNYILAMLGMFGLVGLWADILSAQASIISLASIDNFVRITTSTRLGMTTLGLTIFSLVIAVFFITFSIRLKRGKKQRIKRGRVSLDDKGLR